MPDTWHGWGLKPWLIVNGLRGAKAPLFHVVARFGEFFCSLLSEADS